MNVLIERVMSALIRGHSCSTFRLVCTYYLQDETEILFVFMVSFLFQVDRQATKLVDYEQENTALQTKVLEVSFSFLLLFRKKKM